MSEVEVLIDFGSTFTKVTAVDCDDASVLGRAQAPTTADTDLAIGLGHAIDSLVQACANPSLRSAPRRASSSAAGGLRMVVCGLVPRLTSEAARRAALGAGAKVVGVYSYRLTRSDIAAIELLCPDIVLLSGGTDGGESAVVMHNAEKLAASGLDCPFVVAANRSIAGEAADALAARGKSVKLAANVMPEFGRLEVDPARHAIRDVFIERIVKAKGLEAVQRTLQAPVMPTPMAVLLGAELLARGHGGDAGMGDLLLVDVGGATTDVDSIAKGDPTDAALVLRGLPEPYAKRTVEGDLGIRFNAAHILESAGDDVARHAAARAPAQSCDATSSATDLQSHVRGLGSHVQTLPADDAAHRIDTALARTAVEIAVARHAGYVEHVHMPDGTVAMQVGKDLRSVGAVIGTGGILAHGRDPRYVLEGVRWSGLQPLSLRPRAPRLWMDSLYVFYATGLLAQARPDVALRLQRASLVEI